uniref:Uncharacterized protein n=1 Tax=Caudovirales sp. ctIZM3 TaxID=2827633 RepID=A0A8S5T807_9CAUD|nr:MAG TPA: hypothetical protein [Caudovirales sp. ctIZM3]
MKCVEGSELYSHFFYYNHLLFLSLLNKVRYTLRRV